MAWTNHEARFMAAILAGIGAPNTEANRRALAAWAQAEGGSARWNPFNTTQTAPGATSYNSIGVRNYPSLQAGIHATIQTLKNGYYTGILGALRHGHDPLAVARAIGASPWGTSGQLMAQVLGGHLNVPGAAGGQSQGTNTLQQVLQYARHQLGDPYQWGASGPNAFDCSGLVYAAYTHAGYTGLARTTSGMINQGQKITNIHNLQPGDLIFPSTSHVGLYLGNGRVLSSPHTGAVVHISSLAGFGFLQARRIINGGGGIHVPAGYQRGVNAAGLPTANRGGLGRAAALALASSIQPLRANLANFQLGQSPSQALSSLFPSTTLPAPPPPVASAPAPLAERTQGDLAGLSNLHSSLLPKALSYARVPG